MVVAVVNYVNPAPYNYPNYYPQQGIVDPNCYPQQGVVDPYQQWGTDPQSYQYYSVGE